MTMSDSDKLDQASRCSFCLERFDDVIKIIPECGKSICEHCYEYLKEDADNESGKYQCNACHEEHILSPNGLPDNEHLLLIDKNYTRKLLSENAQKLEKLVKEVGVQLEHLDSFDSSEFVRAYCEKIELEASEAIERAIKHLEEIEKKIMKEIREYREKCLENLSGRSSAEPKEPNLANQLAELKNVVSAFKTKWSNYFERVEAFEEESDIEDALTQSVQHISLVKSMEKRMRMRALNWETMTFNINSQFSKDWNHVGEIFRKMIIQATPLLTLAGNYSSINQLLFLPDGRLASCFDDWAIKIWNAENGEETFKLKGHTDRLFAIALLPNGHLVSGSKDGTIRIWNVEKRNTIRIIKAHSDAVVSLQVLKNGNLASYSCDDTIKIWNLKSNKDEPVSTMNGHGNTILVTQYFGVLSNDYLVTCSRHKSNKEDCILRVWNPNEPNPIKSVSTGFNDAASLLVLSNDQVALGFDRGTIKIIDLNDNALSRTKWRAHDKFVPSLAQLSNGYLVSAGEDGPIWVSNWMIKVWNLPNWRLLQTINTGHTSRIRSLSISACGHFLASGSDNGKIMLWS